VTEEHVGGSRWEGGLGNRRRRPARCFDGFLQRTMAQRPAHVAQRHTRVVRAGRRLEQRSAAMREQRRTVRAEQSGRCSAAIAGRGEMASTTDRQGDGVMHGAAAACVARGVDVAAGRQRQREVAAAAVQQSRTCDASVRASVRGTAHGMAATCAARGGWEAGGTCRSANWHGRDATLAVGISTRSERRPGARVQASDWVGWASSCRRGLGPVRNRAGPH
jgi:hypothetical protein